MDDIEKRARELLAAELGEYEAKCLMEGLGGTVTTREALGAIIAALTPPEGFVLVPVEPAAEMLDAGRAAVMAAHCAGVKWTPRQHFEASGRSTAGIPEDVLDERGPLTKESTAVMVFGSMLAARPEVS